MRAHDWGQRGSTTVVIVMLGVVLTTLVMVQAVQAREVPYLSGRVVDEANLLPPEMEVQLTDRLAALEEQTGAQLVVLTIPSLEGENLEDYSFRVAETWQLGQAEEDNGVLLLVARDDRKLRLEVGYGLEGTLTDLESKVILDEIIVPRFRQGDFAAGIEEGVDVVIRKVRGEEVELPEPGGSTGHGFAGLEALLFLGVWGVGTLPFVMVALFSKGRHSWFLFFFLMPFVSLFPAAVLGFTVGGACLLVWIVAFLLMKYWLATEGGKEWSKRNKGWIQWTQSSGSGSGFSSGGFSSGGFSGGGGSFGGGGASSSW